MILDVPALLAALGSRPAQVAGNLAAQNITGVPEDVCGCPLAVYLTRHGVPFPEVHEGVVLHRTDRGDMHTPLPPAVAEFQRRFDTGMYQFLRARETP